MTKVLQYLHLLVLASNIFWHRISRFSIEKSIKRPLSLVEEKSLWKKPLFLFGLLVLKEFQIQKGLLIDLFPT
jgi:hypothetical protein